MNHSQPPFVFQAHHHSPILNHVVLDIAFNHLDIDSLKTCRQVCERWCHRATPILLHRCTVGLKADNFDQLASLANWMNSDKVPKSRFAHLKCDTITHDTYRNIWPILGDHVRSLEVSHWWGDERDLSLGDYEDLLLYGCCQLEEIVMPCTHKFKNSHNFLTKTALAYAHSYALSQAKENAHAQGRKRKVPGNRRRESKTKKKLVELCPLNLRVIKVTGESRPGHEFWRLVTLCPKLRALSLSCRLPKDIWSIDKKIEDWNERLSNLEFSETTSYANETARETAAKSFQKRRNMKIRTLIYENYELNDTWMRRISEQLQNTLVTLQVTLFNRQDAHYHPHRHGNQEQGEVVVAAVADGQNDWMTSPKLTKLKNYRLELDEQCAGPIFCKGLVHAMLLPNLERLDLTVFEEAENGAEWEKGLFEQIFHDIVLQKFETERQQHSQPQPQSLLPIREKLRALTLPPKMEDTSCIRPIQQIFPNLVQLTLDFPSEVFLTLIFLHWTDLERLTLQLSTEGGWVNWNDVLTGLWDIEQFPDFKATVGLDGLNDLIAGRRGGQTAIHNLKNLKTLDIKVLGRRHGIGEVACPLQDMFLQQGLSRLQATLQHVSIEGHEFSENVVTWLRNEVLPFCHIDFQ